MAGRTRSQVNSYGKTSVGGQATVHQGDRYETGNRFSIQNAQITIYNDPTIPYEAPKPIPDQLLIERPTTGKNFGLLYLDAGLEDALACLCVLKWFMEKVAKEKGVHTAHLPHQYFDMIGGANLGGLFALMLGRLEMSVDECVTAYTNLRSSFEAILLNNDDQLQQTQIIDAWLMKLLRDRSLTRNELFQSNSAASCKVFIHAPCTDDGSFPHWRSYRIYTMEDNMLNSFTAYEVATSILTSAMIHTDKNSTKPIATGDDEERRAHAARSIEAFWLETQTTSLDRSQKLENHLDTMILITTPGLQDLSKTIPINDGRICNLCPRDLIKGAGIETGVVPKIIGSTIDTNISLLRQNDHFANCIRAAAQRPVGCGKSVLAAALIDHAKELEINHIFHYFFDAGHASAMSLDELMRAIVKQLLSASFATACFSSSLQDEIHNLFAQRNLRPSTDQLVAVLQQLIDLAPQSVYLIDGFDDMEESLIQRLFGILRTLFGSQNLHGSKLVLFAREILGRGIETPNALRTIPHVFQIRLTLKQLANDIAAFVETEVDRYQMDRCITPNDDLIKEVKQKLKDNGEKMFLWIHFQILTIWNSDSNTTDNDIRTLIDNLPHGLTETYIACLKRLRYHKNEQYRKIATRTFKWVALAKRPLTLRQAQEAVSLDPQNLQFHESAILNTPVTDFCANLVATDLTNRTVCFTHASVRKFLLDADNILKGTELQEFAIELDRDDLICANLCLSYLEWLQLRKQIIVRKETNLPGNLSPSLLHGIPLAAKAAPVFSRFLAKRSTAPNQRVVLPVPTKMTNEVQLELHNYFIHHWLDHTLKISERENSFERFRKFCTAPNPDYFPQIDVATSKPRLYQSLVYCAVLKGHVPMLRTIINQIQAETSEISYQIFGTALPGTSSLLIHVAAALGDTGVLTELRRVSHIMSCDSEGKTPLAWAAMNRRFEAVSWLMADLRVDITMCQSIPGTSEHISLLAYMAFHKSLGEFWGYVDCHHLIWKPCFTTSFLSQALFAACSAGTVDVAKQLLDLGADAMNFAWFSWPGLAGQIQGWPLLAFLRSGLVGAAETYLWVVEGPLNPPTDDSCMELVCHILNLPGPDAARLSSALCHTRQLKFLKTTFYDSWLEIILQTSTTTSTAKHDPSWRSFVRKILKFEKEGMSYSSGGYLRRHKVDIVHAYLRDICEDHVLQRWIDWAPDDIVDLLRSLGYLDTPITDGPVLWQAVSIRSSRIEHTKVGGKVVSPCLAYDTGAVFDVIRTRGDLWLARDPSDPRS